MHGNNKSDEELRAAAEAGVRFVVLDALDEPERAAAAGVRRALVRVTPGIDADTHEKIRTAHHGSKFGLPPADALEAVRRAREPALDVAGVHLHIGSQLLDPGAGLETIDWLKDFAAPATSSLGRRWSTSAAASASATSRASGRPRSASSSPRCSRGWRRRLAGRAAGGDPRARPLARRPAGLTLYRVGVVKRASDEVTYVAVDGGMSDNPRPQLYGARYSALLANRADDEPTASYDVCGKHCESGDVLIEGARLPEPRRGDLLAVPATGAYTLSMGSNYNAVPRPAAVLVADGQARVIRRRETLDDLLRHEGQWLGSPRCRPASTGSPASCSSASPRRCGASTA